MTIGDSRFECRHQGNQKTADREKEFLAALTSLANSLGIGINDDAKLFVMEADDFAFSYGCDANGRLERL